MQVYLIANFLKRSTKRSMSNKLLIPNWRSAELIAALPRNCSVQGLVYDLPVLYLRILWLIDVLTKEPADMNTNISPALTSVRHQHVLIRVQLPNAFHPVPVFISSLCW